MEKRRDLGWQMERCPDAHILPNAAGGEGPATPDVATYM